MSTQQKVRNVMKLVKVVIIVAFLVLLIVFVWENRKETQVDLIFGEVTMPLSVLILALFIIGLAIGFVIGKAKTWRRI
ncbi:MAG: hypothetical protein AMS15_00280 [Planctomycetes bacterium DG_23]|nr:MAG: hypothetical protein AMS15_00280 [Planctomycetes bacterium DG_23]